METTLEAYELENFDKVFNDAEKEIMERVSVEKFGRNWNELADFERVAIFKIWRIHDRTRLEKFL